MYKVVREFCDTEQNNHVFKVGDTYPLPGYEPTKERIDCLSLGKNAYGEVYLQAIKTRGRPKAE